MSDTLFIFTVVITVYASLISYQLYFLNRNLKKEKNNLEKLNRKLVEKEAYLHTIIKSEPECVKLLSEQGRVIEINPAGVALVQARSIESLIGRCLYDLVAPEHLDAYKQLTTDVFKGKSGKLEFMITSLKGKKLWMETHATPLRDHQNKVVALLAITRDITARKEAEEKTKNKQDELIRVCRHLSVGEMASELAHELNQPLCAIMSYAEIIEEQLQQPDKNLDKIKALNAKLINEAERSGKIIQRMRQFVCKSEPKLSKVDMNVLLEEVIDLLRINKANNGLDVEIVISPSPTTVLADAVQIQQVLINLLTNGLEAMENTPKNERKLTVLCETTRSKLARIVVTDKGEGLCPVNIKKVFEPFFTTKSGGIGVGLSISRSIVEAHGGRIYFTPNENQGTKVTMELPIYEEQQNEAA